MGFQMVSGIVGKTRWQRRHVCAIFQACCAIVLTMNTQVLFFCILLWNLTYDTDEYTPCKLKEWSNVLLVFHPILRQIWNYCFCAMFYAFSNYALFMTPTLLNCTFHMLLFTDPHIALLQFYFLLPLLFCFLQGQIPGAIPFLLLV